VLLVNADRAESYRQSVYVAGLRRRDRPPLLHEKSTFTAQGDAHRRPGVAMAGSSRQIDCAEVHDCFTITEILDIEDLGSSTGPGASPARGRDVAHRSDPGQHVGGLLAKGHPIGATGVAQIVECWWQLRGEPASARSRSATDTRQHNVGGGSGVSVVNILTNH
jgi:acetyl-CoA C-acetyltransferase